LLTGEKLTRTIFLWLAVAQTIVWVLFTLTFSEPVSKMQENLETLRTINDRGITRNASNISEVDAAHANSLQA